MVQLYSTNRKSIDLGNFPLNHDCILKVEYIPSSPMRFEYFTCRAQDSGVLSMILSSLAMVRVVEFSSVDELPDTF